jgi:hypothetical protein
MFRHHDLDDETLRVLIRRGVITLAGYAPGRIYGLLSCPSGRRMRRDNRVFFADGAEALALGFRPCGRCLPRAYAAWKATTQADMAGLPSPRGIV